jgi:hypothetical protein
MAQARLERAPTLPGKDHLASVTSVVTVIVSPFVAPDRLVGGNDGRRGGHPGGGDGGLARRVSSASATSRSGTDSGWALREVAMDSG